MTPCCPERFVSQLGPLLRDRKPQKCGQNGRLAGWILLQQSSCGGGKESESLHTLPSARGGPPTASESQDWIESYQSMPSVHLTQKPNIRKWRDPGLTQPPHPERPVLVGRKGMEVCL